MSPSFPSPPREAQKATLAACGDSVMAYFPAGVVDESVCVRARVYILLLHFQEQNKLPD